MPPDRALNHPFNCLLDIETNEALTRIADDDHCSKAAVIRHLILLQSKMRYDNTPYCADGGACRCPHAHVYGPQNLPSAKPELEAL